MVKIKYILLVVLLSVMTSAEARRWTLGDCIGYALANNTQLLKQNLQKRSAQEDLLQSQAALLPSLSASTSQNVNYQPWPESGRASVQNGYVQSSVDKFFYNGSYGINSNWTLWNGGRNTNTVKLNRLYSQQAELDSAVTANSIQEQIAQIYVQILYSAEAIEVSKQMLETSKANEDRGKEFVAVGKMSKADLAQLSAQRAQDEYSLVEAESNLRNFKRQMKEVLQITDDEEFDVVMPETSDELALQDIPLLNDVYGAALNNRPEIKNAMMGVEGSKLSLKIAKAQRLPSLGLNASVGTNTTSMSDTAFGTQLKSNLNVGAGLSVSIPIFDNRQAKTAANKALIQRENYLLDLKDKQTALYSTIENYWLQAVNNQNKFKAARVSTESAQASYDLLSEKFRLKMINTVELMNGWSNLMSARQNELQSKYLAILNINMLKFYENGKVK